MSCIDEVHWTFKLDIQARETRSFTDAAQQPERQASASAPVLNPITCKLKSVRLGLSRVWAKLLLRPAVEWDWSPFNFKFNCQSMNPSRS